MHALLHQYVDGAPLPCVAFQAPKMAFWSQEPVALELALMGHTASLRARAWGVMHTCHAGNALGKRLAAGVALPIWGIVFRVLNGVLWVLLRGARMLRLPQAALHRDQVGSTVMGSTASANKHITVAV